MGREIIHMLAHVKETTGREIRVYSDEQDVFYSTLENDVQERFLGKVSETVVNEKNSKTYFTFKYNAQRYTGYIDGVTEADKTIATLIGALLENGIYKEPSGRKEDSLASAIIGECSGMRLQKVIGGERLAQQDILQAESVQIFAPRAKFPCVRVLSCALRTIGFAFAAKPSGSSLTLAYILLRSMMRQYMLFAFG